MNKNLKLIKPASPWRVLKRPRGIPLYWENIAGNAGISSYVERRDWQLVLNARNIPFMITDSMPARLYTPPLWSYIAKREIAQYIQENKSFYRKKFYRVKNGAFKVLYFVIPLFIIHALNSGFWIGPDWLPGKNIWTEAGCLNKTAVIVQGEWERIFTALMLHANLRHLSGNILFGALFLIILARITGPGAAILLSVMGGGAGNALSVILHAGTYSSVGFSTAIFSAIGSVAGIVGILGRSKRKFLLSFGSALGLLAFMGMDGENTDILAHVMGLMTGLLEGCLYGEAIKRNWNLPSERLGGIVAGLIMLVSWVLAFNNKSIFFFNLE